MDEIRRTRFFFKWVLASVVGWVVGWAVIEATTRRVVWPWIPDIVGESTVWAVVWPVALVGALSGTIQWLMLREQLSRAGWCLVASAVGCAVAAAGMVGTLRAVPWAELMVWAVPGGVRGAVVGAAVGALSGTIQWLMLRKQLSRAGWWVVASTLGWAAAAAGMAATVVVLGIGLAVGWVVGGVVVGVVTGAALVWLLRQPAVPGREAAGEL